MRLLKYGLDQKYIIFSGWTRKYHPKILSVGSGRAEDLTPKNISIGGAEKTCRKGLKKLQVGGGHQSIEYSKCGKGKKI